MKALPAATVSRGGCKKWPRTQQLLTAVACPLAVLEARRMTARSHQSQATLWLCRLLLSSLSALVTVLAFLGSDHSTPMCGWNFTGLCRSKERFDGITPPGIQERPPFKVFLMSLVLWCYLQVLGSDTDVSLGNYRIPRRSFCAVSAVVSETQATLGP